MFVRLTFCKFLPEKINEAKRIFTKEIMPAVRKQKRIGQHQVDGACQ